MKELLTITIILASTFTFGQNIDTSNIKRYVIGGRVVECNDCWIDFCGNLVKTNGDTLAINSRTLNSTDKPIYLTKDNVLLSTVTAKKFTENKNVKSLTVIKCNSGRPVFGDIAKRGIIIIELIKGLTDAVTLTEFLSTKLTRHVSDESNIYINGLLTTDRKMKVSKSDLIKVQYDMTTDCYNLATE
jgi:hypothetical protein